ncbi:MAG TPA: plastocyanin/azurin family copper-binding protein [Chloroflexota bacterium]|nr:plastocyanin/azurin family copper-binding protein [Chloroflexota bacterium]
MTSAADGPAVSIHDGGDPTTWGYTPASTSVSVGQTVTWTNSGAFPHDAAATDGSWKTPLLNTGQSGSVTFSTPGTYTYICTPHPWMQATIVVTAAVPAAPTAAPAADAPAAIDPAPAVQPADAPAATNPATDASAGQPADINTASPTDPGTGD